MAKSGPVRILQRPASQTERIRHAFRHGAAETKEDYYELQVYMEHGACETAPESAMFDDPDINELNNAQEWGAPHGKP